MVCSEGTYQKITGDLLQPACIIPGPQEELGDYHVSPQSLLEEERAGLESDTMTIITCPGKLGLKHPLGERAFPLGLECPPAAG